MKRHLLKSLAILLLFISCKKETPTPKFYRNLYSGEVFTESEFKQFRKSLYLEHAESGNTPSINYVFSSPEKSLDSILINFKYDLRVGTRYLVRVLNYEKIGMEVPLKKFTSINGEEITIGGKQDKPTMINLWFINCPGCIEEMPALNLLREKYSDSVNFIALTFEKEKDVLKFLKKVDFKFSQIAEVQDFINEIGSRPYPESIFIDKKGIIRNIEGPIPYESDIDKSIVYFEQIIQSLLEEE